ncbi:MAG: response regulator [Verrucomicrobiales bacterium]|nr:response regulator [Verrucomicrobiales bacterium]
MNEPPLEISRAYAENERVQGAQRLRVGCWLVMVLLPAGHLVDRVVYEPESGLVEDFLWVRLACAALIVPLLYLFHRPAGIRWYGFLSLMVAVLPAAAMSYIIHRDDAGPASGYYASINLILLAIAMVAQWTWKQSLMAVSILLGMYFAGTVPRIFDNLRQGTDTEVGPFLNNVWFMLLTGIIVVVGSELTQRLRLRDFQLTYELEESRKHLQRSYRQLQELDELKGRFFANISHELRTPLTLLLAPLEKLIKHPPTADPALSELLVIMHANGMRLLKLINDLLDLVQLEAGQLKLKLQTVQVGTFLKGMVSAVKAVADERSIRIEHVVDPALTTIQADPDKLEKVFLNLLFNAIKFTRAGGAITVSARAEGEVALFAVRDDGVGIAAEHLPFLFSRFWQADSSSIRRHPGAGIGLALVKELVAAHGGAVSAESAPGQGTTISMRLPFHPAATGSSGGEAASPTPEPASPAGPLEPDAPATPPEPEATQAAWLNDLYRRAELFASVPGLRSRSRPLEIPGRGGRPKVLVVDDERDMLSFVSTQLAEDYEIIEAIDGDQAVTLTEQYIPDVVVCDLMLPGKDGLEVCREIRRRTSTQAVPVLIVTASADDEAKLSALASGANDLLTKPFSLAELRARVKALSDNTRLQRTLLQQNQRLEATLDELRETESQLVQAEKMASLGRMSAGIIHEINNPLNYSLTAIDLLAMYADELDPAGRADYDSTLRDVRDGLRRVSGIVGDLREFTHPQGGSLDTIPVRHAAETALRFLAAEWKGKVNVRNEIPEDLEVSAVSGRLMQVFVNLLQNSLDAVRSRDAATGEPEIRLTAEVGAATTLIRVWDNGPGIPEHHRDKVFDPFFTTKEVGQGTGLGLSICYRLLRDVGAALEIRSEVGRFCEFVMIFPRKPAPRTGELAADLVAFR